MPSIINEEIILQKSYHKKVIAGAVLILDPSINPVAPATMHPTANPTIILIFLRNGEPSISVSTMLTKDKNPMPINSGEPHSKGRGAKIVGQSWNIPSAG